MIASRFSLGLRHSKTMASLCRIQESTNIYMKELSVSKTIVNERRYKYRFLDPTYSMPIERRDTLTTSKSKMLKEFRQKEPL